MTFIAAFANFETSTMQFKSDISKWDVSSVLNMDFSKIYFLNILSCDLFLSDVGTNSNIKPQTAN